VPGQVKPQWPHAGLVFEAEADGTLHSIDTNLLYVSNTLRCRQKKNNKDQRWERPGGERWFKIKQDKGIPAPGILGDRVPGAQLIPVSPPEGLDTAGKKAFADRHFSAGQTIADRCGKGAVPGDFKILLKIPAEF